MRPLRVCFHAPLLWPLWSEGRIAFTGGAEVQQAHLARGLAARGIEMSVVSCDYGQPDGAVAHGVRVLRSYRLDAGLPVLRFFHPRLSRTLAALHRADADVYYTRGASLEAATAYEVARARGAAFVFGVAHDLDVVASLPRLKRFRDRVWFRRALHGADAIVAQSLHQQQTLKAESGLSSVIVRNLVHLPEAPADPGQPGPIVWVATYKASKRPEWFLELARALPGERFIMAGVVPIPPEPLDAWEQVRAAAASLPNLEVRGYQEADAVAALHRASSLFVHTSPAEGFPNSVLEAWSHGVPSVCAFDPEGAIREHGLGEVVDSSAALIEAVRGWSADAERRRAAGRRAREYARQMHSPDRVLDDLVAVFDRVARTRRPLG